MKNIRFAHSIITTLLKDRTHYVGRLLVDTASLIARCGVLLLLYSYVFALNGGEVNGTAFLYVAWSILIYFIFMTYRLRDVARSIMLDVQSGTVEVLFSKPVSYLAYKMWWQVGAGMYSFLASFIIGTSVLTLVLGVPDTMRSLTFVFTFPITLILAVLLSLLIYGIVGLLAFWIEEVNPVFWIVDKAVMILGGSYLPIALFPDFLYKLALYSPFGASQFITHTVYEPWLSNWYELIFIQLLWVVALCALIYVMFARAQQRVSVNGG